uniref:uncharacterized protein LOC122586718 n=1 Tax=Erigeron canadensis TaxID=72917 RepID=UPI001CB8A3BD|nr:uncharacterized protein LOC122586718 [Erigeron canadensis]
MDSNDSSGSSSGSSNGHDDYEDRVHNVILRAAQLVQRRLIDQPAPIIHQRVPVDRNRIEAHARLMHDYFDDQLRYNARLFRKRFRMTKPLFMRIVGDLEARYPYFQTRYDRAGRRGFAEVQKCTSAIRQLAYGVNSDFLNEYLQMSKRTSKEACLKFCIVPFSANGNHYAKGYYLGDGIYPEYATFVKTFFDPIDEKRRLFKKKQKSTRKGIERAFGVLKKRWKALKHPALYWDKKSIQDFCYACIILHNMILKDEGKAVCQDYNAQEPSLNPDYWSHQTPMEVRIQNLHTIKNRETHNMLTAYLVDHLWANTPHDFEPPADPFVPPADPFVDLRDYVSTDDDDSA